MNEVANRTCPACRKDTREAVCPDDGTATVARQLFKKDALSYLPGDTVAGRYRIVGALGRGAFGAVYSARHTGTNQPVALKMLALDIDGPDGKVHEERFYREARTTAQLRHHNTVRVFDVGQTEEGPLFLAMELLQGPSLAQYLRREFDAGRKFSEPHAIDLAIATLKSLSEAHRAGLVHRDIKPGNIVLHRSPDDETIVKLLDFGIARSVGSNLTQTGQSLGTPAYMSPEQARGEVLDGRSDQYAMGVLIYLLVTGRLPFSSDDVMALLFMHVNNPTPDPRQFDDVTLSEAFVDALLKSLAKSRDDRFADAKEMWQALAAIRSDRHGAVPEFSLRGDDALWAVDDVGRDKDIAGPRTQSAAPHEGATRRQKPLAEDLEEETAEVNVRRISLLPKTHSNVPKPASPQADERPIAEPEASASESQSSEFQSSESQSSEFQSLSESASGRQQREVAEVVAAERAPTPQKRNMRVWIAGGVALLIGGVAVATTTMDSGPQSKGGATSAAPLPLVGAPERATPTPQPGTAAPQPATPALGATPTGVPAARDASADKARTAPSTARGDAAIRKAEARVAFKMAALSTKAVDKIRYVKDAIRLDPGNPRYVNRLVALETKAKTAEAARHSRRTTRNPAKKPGKKPAKKPAKRAAANPPAAGDELQPEFVD